MNDFAREYIDTVVRRVKYYKDLADKTFAQLAGGDFHFRFNEESNSIAIIIQHMAGNMLSRWTNFLSEDGEKQWRERDAEFESVARSRAELIDLWETGWTCFGNALLALREDDLLKTVTIRDEPLTVIDAINRQLAHYPYHVGQIVYIGRMIKGGEWTNLSIAKGDSRRYNASTGSKDPSKKFG